LPCLLTAAIGTAKNNPETYAVNEFVMEPYVTTMLSIRTIWRRNAVTILMVKNDITTLYVGYRYTA